MIFVDMVKARNIARDIIREERESMFATLDVDFMRAVEAGDTVRQQEIAQKKQKLRDVTDHTLLEQAATPEELLELGKNWKTLLTS